ncbi:hypothetical protein YPPY72_2531, partial [Yersinia pestis PY-72]
MSFRAIATGGEHGGGPL